MTSSKRLRVKQIAEGKVAAGVASCNDYKLLIWTRCCILILVRARLAEGHNDVDRGVERQL
jgi:hypothetical protein